MQGLSLVVASGGHSSSRCAGLSLSWPLVAEHRFQTRRLSNCGSRAQSLHGMWDPPRPGLEPESPALAGRPSTTAPPGKTQRRWTLRAMSTIYIFFPFSLFVSVYVYASVCDFVCIALLLPFVLGFCLSVFSFFFS